MKIVLTKDAESHLYNGMNFYESQKEGLGNYILDSIASDIESLQIFHGIHVKINNYHRLLSKRFPYAIYYKYDDRTIYIYAILDCRQKPTKNLVD